MESNEWIYITHAGHTIGGVRLTDTGWRADGLWTHLGTFADYRVAVNMIRVEANECGEVGVRGKIFDARGRLT